MADSLADLEKLGADLIANLGPGPRRRLMSALSVDMQRANMARIAAQQNLDGSPFEPRKPQTPRERTAPGRLRRKAAAKAMFAKLRRASLLKAAATADEASAGFSGRTARIARGHHEGLRDRVSLRTKATVKYPERQLIGFAPGDPARYLDLILAHVTQ